MNICCIIAALLFFTGNLLLMIFYVKERNRSHFNLDTYHTLDVDYLKLEWGFRETHRPKFLAAGLINALAWFFFSFPIVHLAWILSHRGKSSLGLHVGIAVFALIGCFTEWISRFLQVGAGMASMLVAKNFELDNWVSSSSDDGIGWKALEINHILTRGLTSFVDTFEWIVMFVMMVMIHVSVRRWRSTDNVTFGAVWNSLGLFIALLCLLDFVAEVLRLEGLEVFSQVAFWYAAVNRLVLIPIWLLLLGWRLPYAALKINEPQQTMTDMQAEGGAL